MFVWELIADRLRNEGWQVWHRTERVAQEPTYTVVIHRPGIEWRASGPTLTEAFAEAARGARRQKVAVTSEPAPHFLSAGVGFLCPATAERRSVSR
jgi:hypothetical protein